MNLEDWLFIGIVVTVTLIGFLQHQRIKKLYGDDDGNDQL